MRRKETVGAPVPSKADLHRVTTEEKLFHSDYNVPPGHAPAQNEVRWALRGYLPPKHLRIDGYNYGLPEDSAVVFADASPNIVKRESTTALMAGCFVPDSEAEMDVGAQSETSHARVTLTEPNTRVVKGNMAQRPSWGQYHYDQAASSVAV